MHQKNSLHRERNKNLGLLELVAIALGGMVGGGIFTILGISVSMIGAYTPVAIAIGGIMAALAAYSYIKLGVYFRDEGATYSFFKKSFPRSPFAASVIGWWVMFGYISTLALYAYTFAAYAISALSIGDNTWVRKAVAGAVLLVFTLINVWSVKGMGKVEDIMVYTKLIILIVISFVLINNTHTTLPTLLSASEEVGLFAILIVASLTFVAYEGFQLVINAVNEMEQPEKSIPAAIYTAIGLAMLVYIVMAVGAVLAIPFEDIIGKQEYALASGANGVLGHWGTDLVIVGALLATSSAISGTLFGASRQMAVIAQDGYFPEVLAKRKHRIPVSAIVTMAFIAFLLVLAGSLELILEFGSITFLIVSLLMAYANYRLRHETQSSSVLALIAIFGLSTATVMIMYYEFNHKPVQFYVVIALYGALTLGAWLYSVKNRALERWWE